jgi:hypothetical protein
MVVFEETQGMVVIPRNFAAIVEITLSVGKNDVDVDSIRLQRNRVRVTVRADPERERGCH